MIPREIHIHIDRIIVEGLDARNIDGLEKAMTLELERLVSRSVDTQYPSADSQVAVLKVAPVEQTHATTGVAVGKRIAQTVFGKLGE